MEQESHIEGNHARSILSFGCEGYIAVEKIDRCYFCENEKVIGIKTDTSEEEYGAMQICFGCIENLRKAYENKKE